MSSYAANYIEKELIGRGHYGMVYLVEQKRNSQLFVAKKIQLHGMSEQQRETALKQVKIHQHLKHKNILQFQQYFLENNTLIMIMQYCQFGDLSVYIKQRKQKGEYLQEPLIVNLFVQMLFGLNYLHENKILHRDIKTQNIFIDSEGSIKLADFGISKMLQHTQHLASTVVGTPYYLSPQACSNTGYSFKSDIWSLGCVLYELSTLQHPFSGDNILSLAKKITCDEPKQISQKYSYQLSTLIKLMLKKNPSQRPSIKQILSTKWISDYVIKFKMNDSMVQNKYQSQNQCTLEKNESREYPIFQTRCELQNQFLDLQYEKGQIKAIRLGQSPQRVSKNKEDVVISPTKSRVSGMRQKCIQQMGQFLFQQIYNLMKTARSEKLSESKVQQMLRKQYSKRQFELSMDVAQLIYLEEIDNN